MLSLRQGRRDQTMKISFPNDDLRMNESLQAISSSELSSIEVQILNLMDEISLLCIQITSTQL